MTKHVGFTPIRGASYRVLVAQAEAALVDAVAEGGLLADARFVANDIQTGIVYPHTRNGSTFDSLLNQIVLLAGAVHGEVTQ